MSLIPQFGFFELLLIGALALVIIGPQDLPRLMVMAGRQVRQLRALAGEFRAAIRQMAKEIELDELEDEIEAIKSDNVFADAKRSVDEVGDALRDETAEIRDEVTKPVDTVQKTAPKNEQNNNTTSNGPTKNSASVDAPTAATSEPS